MRVNIEKWKRKFVKISLMDHGLHPAHMIKLVRVIFCLVEHVRVQILKLFYAGAAGTLFSGGPISSRKSRKIALFECASSDMP